MSLGNEWRKVLDFEVQRWSAMSCGQSKQYQVEVELLENTERYLHVMVTLDDGSLPASISPLTRSFICQSLRLNLEHVAFIP
jgi:hypothetical protein